MFFRPSYGPSHSALHHQFGSGTELMTDVKLSFLVLQMSIWFKTSECPRRLFSTSVAVIDGSHIPIMATQEYHTEYFNRKDWYSIYFQAVVDGKVVYFGIFL